MEKLLNSISRIGVIPVIKIEDAKDAVPLANALKNGGICAAEITFRTAAAADAIKEIATNFPDFLIAAGTVLTPKQADQAIEAGASLIVTPGFNPIVVNHCLEKGYPIIPGVCTPGEIENAMSFGLRYLKFFPAEAMGGVKTIKAVSAPYSMIRFMPTGGINKNNLAEYLNCKSVFACGGSFMVPSDLISSGRFDEIEKLTLEAAELVKEIRE